MRTYTDILQDILKNSRDMDKGYDLLDELKDFYHDSLCDIIDKNGD